MRRSTTRARPLALLSAGASSGVGSRSASTSLSTARGASRDGSSSSFVPSTASRLASAFVAGASASLAPATMLLATSASSPRARFASSSSSIRGTSASIGTASTTMYGLACLTRSTLNLDVPLAYTESSCPSTTTSCASTRINVPIPASFPSARRNSDPNAFVPTKGVSSNRPLPGTMSYVPSSSASYARTIGLRPRSMRLLSRAPSSTRSFASRGSRRSLAKSVSQRGSKRFSRAREPGRQTYGYGTMGTENSPGSFSPTYSTNAGVRSSPKTSTVRDFAASSRVDSIVAPTPPPSGGGAASNHAPSYGSGAETSRVSSSSDSFPKKKGCMNGGTMGMSRNSIWSCCALSVAVDAERYVLRRLLLAALTASRRDCAAARAKSASSSRLRSSSSASSSPRSALSASMVFFADVPEGSEGGAAGAVSSAASAPPPNRHHARALTESRPARSDESARARGGARETAARVTP
mmetsp:Transcript_11653/g.48857  ORF Transcript_11653/g.48857 Transcript_11653/m.48857 type:complete len:469 (-) Transcript_11653:95-1501(-)